MKYITILTILSVLLAGACVKQKKTVKKTTTQKPGKSALADRVSVMYNCDGRIRIHVLYINNPDGKGYRVQVDYGRKEFLLPSVMSASGARYSNGTITWWTKGYEAFMMVNDVITIRNCREQTNR